ncbi:MAG: 4-hydroxy-tetrahydrodipicolinate reductase [Polyangiaceae bacterium]|nr:4-hydroxy-tetrahydrodipicolinate reductase [Polyangiaceae bacterium]
MKLAIHGATGRMGLTIARLAHAAADIELVGAGCAPNDPAAGRDLGELAGLGTLGVVATPDQTAAVLGAEVVVDFSTAAAVVEIAAAAAREGVALMSGTTHLDPAAQRALDQAAALVPVLWAPNTSLGVQVLAELVEQAVRRLGPDYDVEIVEIHHRRKVDAPSGTARRLGQAVEVVRPGAREVSGRDGEVGARQSDELGVLAVRGGDVVGDHTVHLLGPGERLELTHRAHSRDLLAQGALRAARWLLGKAPGRYAFRDLLGG